MRYGIFSDVHGNLQALEAVAKSLKRQRIDRYIFLGDVVGYGANPRECMETVSALKALGIAGNHDWAVLGKISTQYFNPLAREAVLWTQKNITGEDMAFLQKLQLTYKGEHFHCVHGTLNSPEYFQYLMDRWQARDVFSVMTKNICFVGHSHVAGVFVEKNKKIAYASCVDISIEDGCRYIVNVGSVGQPRDGNPMAAFCIFDTDKKEICVKRINYDIEEAQKRILQRGLPPFLASRLSSGH